MRFPLLPEKPSQPSQPSQLKQPSHPILFFTLRPLLKVHSPSGKKVINSVLYIR